MKKFAYNLGQEPQWDLREAAAPPYMGLTANVGGELALIKGYDGKRYILEGEEGQVFHTANIVVSSDDVVDTATMEHNAVIAALRTEGSPFTGEGVIVEGRYIRLGELEYDPHSGAWDLPIEDFGGYRTLGELLSELDGATVKAAAEGDDGITEEEIAELIRSWNDGEDWGDADIREAFPYMLAGALDPDTDGYEFEPVKKLMNRKVGFVAPLVGRAAGAILPRIGLGSAVPAVGRAIEKIPGVGGMARSMLQSIGLGTLFGGRGGPQQPAVKNQREHQFGLYSYVEHDFAGEGDMSYQVVAASGDPDMIEALRAQVMAALNAWAPSVSQDLGDLGDNVWWALMSQAEKAETVAEMQTILQCIPEQYRDTLLGNTPPTTDEEIAPMPIGGGVPGAAPRIPGPAEGVPEEPPGPAAPPAGGRGRMPAGPPDENPEMYGRIPGSMFASVEKEAAPEFEQEFNADSTANEFERMYQEFDLMKRRGFTDRDFMDKFGQHPDAKEVVKTWYDNQGNSDLQHPVAKTKEAIGPGMVQQYQQAVKPAIVPAAIGQQNNTQMAAQVQQLAQKYMNQGMPFNLAYQQALAELTAAQAQQQVGVPAGTAVQNVPQRPAYAAAHDETYHGTKCPNCDGHTYQYAGDNFFKCLTCGHEWKENFRVNEASIKETKWKDTEGRQLEVGKIYKMTSPDYIVPDYVRVLWAEPENIRINMVTSAMDVDIQDDEGYRFEPVDAEVDSEGRLSFNEGGTEEPVPGLEWLKEDNDSSTDAPLVDPAITSKYAGKSFTPQEQRRFIDEPGTARNVNKLRLDGTHYLQSNFVDIDPKGDFESISDDAFLIG